MSCVLLTGALGNIGLSTLEALLEEGHDVVAFDLESPRARKLVSRLDGRVRVVWGDITDPLSIRAALDGVDAVVHLAAIVNPERAPDLARRVNVDATCSLIAQMQASPTARRLVFASSVGVFGDVQDREPPLRTDMRAGASGSGSKHASISQRSAGTSRMASRPSCSNAQNACGSSAPPGNRQPMPTIAIGSRACAASSFSCNSRASNANRLGESLATRSRKSLVTSWVRCRLTETHDAACCRYRRALD
jgi:hypothetical protein